MANCAECNDNEGRGIIRHCGVPLCREHAAMRVAAEEERDLPDDAPPGWPGRGGEA